MVVGSLGVMALALIGCGPAEAKTPSLPSAAAVASELARQGNNGTNSGAGGSAQNGATKGSGSLTQTNSGGSVTLAVTWQRSEQASAPLVFSVAMDTHSVNLDGIDLAKSAVLRTDAGVEVKPEKWESPPGGHHRSGSITFPSKDGSGKPLLGSGVKSIELVIRDVASVKERVLRWEVS